MYQPFVVVAGEEKTSRLFALELLQQHIGQCNGKIQIGLTKFRLHQFQQSVQHKRIIIEIGVEMRLATLIGCQQAVIFP